MLVIFDVPSILRLSHTMSQGVPHYVPSVPDMSQPCPIPTLDAGVHDLAVVVVHVLNLVILILVVLVHVPGLIVVVHISDFVVDLAGLIVGLAGLDVNFLKKKNI